MQGYSSSLVLFGDSISRIREFSFARKEKVDVCIELVRIREFDGSGGRIELFNALFPSFSNPFNSTLSQLFACTDIRLHWFNSVIQSQELEN